MRAAMLVLRIVLSIVAVIVLPPVQWICSLVTRRK